MHHNDLPDLDPRHDITDLFVFAAAERPGRTVIVLDVHPELTPGVDPVDPTVSHEIKLDLDGDLHPDLAFHVVFSRADRGHGGTSPGGTWTASVYRATGAGARDAGAIGGLVVSEAPLSTYERAQTPSVTVSGDYRFFAGPRSDPFFADRDGFAEGMRWTGRDYFADKDVFAIVLEIPDRDLGPAGRAAVWARTVSAGPTPRILNLAGRPGNNVFRPNAEAFQATEPTQQRERFRGQYVDGFLRLGHSIEAAEALATEWVPDVLRYDRHAPSGFPNGRRLTDDVVDVAVRVLTRAPIPSAGRLAPHQDLLPGFPHLGPPHAGPAHAGPAHAGAAHERPAPDVRPG